jgi:hypothetical protein
MAANGARGEIMRDIDLFQLALGLVPPWMVVDAKFDADKKRLDIEIDFIENEPGDRAVEEEIVPLAGSANRAGKMAPATSRKDDWPRNCFQQIAAPDPPSYNSLMGRWTRMRPGAQ